MLKRTLIVGLALGLLASPGLAQNDAEKADQPAEREPNRLVLGDKAPALHISKWLKGDPVERFESGHVYVVEFWATWCGPCIRGMPHISELQAKYEDKDVTVIGVNIWERNPENVPQWMEDRGNELMKYTVAMEEETKMADNWMKPAGARGIPTAFIVDQTGHVAWIGHPMRMDVPLERVVAGDWDTAAEREKALAEKRRERAAAPLNEAIRMALDAGDFETAIAKMDELIELKPPRVASTIVGRFQITLKELGDVEAAYVFINKHRTAIWDSAPYLNSVSWIVLTEVEGDDRNLPMALAWADRACELTDYKDAAILDTLAKAYFDMGQVARAIEYQRKSFEHAPEGQMKDEIEQRLEEYEAEMKMG